MKDEINEEKAKAILDALDRAINAGSWDESNFLRIIGKNLRQIRENFAKEAIPEKKSLDDTKSQNNVIGKNSSEFQEIYISLYAHEGSLLQTWERLLANLPKQVVSRPVYTDEKDVQFLIRSKENKINEAYAVVKIRTQDILQLPPDKVSKDRFGKPLLALIDQAVQLQNIIRFVHISGTYKYRSGRLVMD